MAGRPTNIDIDAVLRRRARNLAAARERFPEVFAPPAPPPSPPPPARPGLPTRFFAGVAGGLAEPVDFLDIAIRRLAATAGRPQPERIIPALGPEGLRDLPPPEGVVETVVGGVGHGLGVLPQFLIQGALARTAATRRVLGGGAARLADLERLAASGRAPAAVTDVLRGIRAAEFAGEIAVPAAGAAIQGRPEEILPLAAGLAPIRPISRAVAAALPRTAGPVAQGLAQVGGAGAGGVAGGAAARGVTGQPVIPSLEEGASEFATLGILGGVPSVAKDRKSTRLNSSHSQISYA